MLSTRGPGRSAAARNCRTVLAVLCGLGLQWTATVALGAPGDSPKPVATAAFSEPSHTDVRPSRFQEIIPGETTRATLIETAGAPQSEDSQGEETVYTYKLGPFRKVEVIVAHDVVESIVAHLESPTSAASIADELGLSNFVPAIVYGSQSEVLGQVYPERGVALSFAPNSTDGMVSQIVLEPISPQFFLLRAKSDTSPDYERKIADLNYVLQADPQNAQARGLKAEVFAAAGYYGRALTNVVEALKADPANLRHRLLLAELHHQHGRYTAALEEAQQVLSRADSSLIHGRAEALLGNLIANGPGRDYQAAMEHHLAAVELLRPLLVSPQLLVRRAARKEMLEVHLAIANDITHGQWAGKKESAPEWLKLARELSEQLIAEDEGDEIVRLYLYHQALASYVGMRGQVDPAEVAETALQLGKRLLSQTNDRLRRRELQWLLVDALVEAVRAEQLRGTIYKVTQYTREADELIRTLAQTEESEARVDFTRGRLYFLIGTTFAIEAGDHQRAVSWFDKAKPHLMKTHPPAGSVDLVRHGQRFVSMGVSYWETNGRDEALRLTERGLQLMSAAVEQGNLDKAPLAVAYGNLAAMYRSIGRPEDAKRLAARASQIESGAGEAITR